MQPGWWHVVDPLEQYHSGYLAMGNNPLINIDPSGMFADYFYGHQVYGYDAYRLHKWMQYNSHFDYTTGEMVIIEEPTFDINTSFDTGSGGGSGISIDDIADLFMSEFLADVTLEKMINWEIKLMFQQKEDAQSEGGRPDLGFVGNEIRDRAGSEFSKDLFENYWLAGGDITLSEDRFNAIANAAKKLQREYYFVTLSNGQPGVKAIVNFYGSDEYSLAFGRATIYYNKKGQAVGFSDYYNFDPKAWGVRSNKAEINTRMVNAAGALYGAQPYNITFGIGIHL